MKIEIVVEGLLKNKVYEKEVPEESLVSTICFINEHGYYYDTGWIPPHKIKEIRYEYPAASLNSRVFKEDKTDD
jgi:hypothetical protein